MSTPGTPLQLCRGRRNGAGPLLGLCIACARQSDSRAPLEPAAQMAQRGGTWQCVNRVPVAALRQATNEVKVRGEKLAPVSWKGAQWAVTAYGLEARDGTYAIEKRRLLDRRGDRYEWPEHMGEKTWVDMADFRRAFAVALHAHHGVQLPQHLRNAAGA